MEINCVFFDFGDTIAFNNASFPQSLHAALLSMGIQCDLSHLNTLIQAQDRATIRRRYEARSEEAYRALRIRYYSGLLNSLSIPDNGFEVSTYLYEIMPFYHGTYLKPETSYVLDILKEHGYQLGIISNFSHLLPSLCKKLGVDRYMDFIVYSDDVGVEKPHPQIFKTALTLSGSQPGQCIHIGDSYEADVLGARAVGIEPILIQASSVSPREDCVCIFNLLSVLNYLKIKHPLKTPFIN